MPQALTPGMMGQVPIGEEAQVWEESGVWIRHLECESHMGRLVVMQASRREFWAGEGELGCLDLPEQDIPVSLSLAGQAQPHH